MGIQSFNADMLNVDLDTSFHEWELERGKRNLNFHFFGFVLEFAVLSGFVRIDS